ncbi:MAG: AI-2E family transporter, partial [Candidatus Rokuibacteriota bacterium]
MSERADPARLIVWTVVAVAGVAVLLWVLYLARAVLLLIYVSALFAIGMSPLVRLIETQRLLPIGTRRFPRWVAILLVYLGVLGVIAAIVLMVVPPLVSQARELTTELPRYAARAQEFLLERGIITEPITLREAIEQAPGRG